MEFISFDTSEFYSDGIWTWDNSEKVESSKYVISLEVVFQVLCLKLVSQESSAFKMADCPFYSQALLAYKEGPLLKERGCEVERVSLKGKRESFFTFVSMC